jgi:hypothetical protein
MATAAFTFNIAKGKVNRYADLPAANDALVLVLLQTTGLESDATLQDYDTLSAILAGANDECTFTGYARRTLTGVTVSPDDTGNSQSADAADPASWTNTGGAAQGCGAAIVCYDPDTTTGTDADLVPLVQLMVGTVTFDVGVAVSPVFNAAGLFTAS